MILKDCPYYSEEYEQGGTKIGTCTNYGFCLFNISLVKSFQISDPHITIPRCNDIQQCGYKNKEEL